MKALKVYVACTLKHATEEYKQFIAEFKKQLAERAKCTILEFVTDPHATAGEIYQNDIKGCVVEADVIVADLSSPSHGVGYEISTMVEAHNKPVIGVARTGSQVSGVLLGIPGFELGFYDDMETLLDYVVVKLALVSKKTPGRLIVIDGTDGSGKATQTKLLVERFQQVGEQVQTFDFPHYKNHFGGLIGECLAGKHGDFVGMSPQVASVLYAADRFESSQKIKSWLAEGAIVILDRYVSANQIHQGGKIPDEENRKKFLDWLDRMEHEIFQIPRPDLIIYLDVPVEVSQRLAKEKNAASKKIYTESSDQHEDNIQHLKDAKESGLKMIASLNSWHRVNCYQDNQILPIGVIHDEVWRIATSY